MIDQLRKACEIIRALLAEPYGCTLCDCGKPRRPEKGHQLDCPYELAQNFLNSEPCEGYSEKVEHNGRNSTYC